MLNLDWIKNMNDGDAKEEFSKHGRSLSDRLGWLFESHIEVLRMTPDERKAVELAISMGLPWISWQRDGVFLCENDGLILGIRAASVPALRVLEKNGVFMIGSEPWIFKVPQDLRELILRDKGNAGSEGSV